MFYQEGLKVWHSSRIIQAQKAFGYNPLSELPRGWVKILLQLVLITGIGDECTDSFDVFHFLGSSVICLELNVIKSHKVHLYP